MASRAMLVILLALGLWGCAPARAVNTHAEVIPSQKPGVTCMAIVSEGQVVGGSCFKD